MVASSDRHGWQIDRGSEGNKVTKSGATFSRPANYGRNGGRRRVAPDRLETTERETARRYRQRAAELRQHAQIAVTQRLRGHLLETRISTTSSRRGPSVEICSFCNAQLLSKSGQQISTQNFLGA